MTEGEVGGGCRLSCGGGATRSCLHGCTQCWNKNTKALFKSIQSLNPIFFGEITSKWSTVSQNQPVSVSLQHNTIQCVSEWTWLLLQPISCTGPLNQGGGGCGAGAAAVVGIVIGCRQRTSAGQEQRLEEQEEEGGQAEEAHRMCLCVL